MWFDVLVVVSGVVEPVVLVSSGRSVIVVVNCSVGVMLCSGADIFHSLLGSSSGVLVSLFVFVD